MTDENTTRREFLKTMGRVVATLTLGGIGGSFFGCTTTPTRGYRIGDQTFQLTHEQAENIRKQYGENSIQAVDERSGSTSQGSGGSPYQTTASRPSAPPIPSDLEEVRRDAKTKVQGSIANNLIMMEAQPYYQAALTSGDREYVAILRTLTLVAGFSKADAIAKPLQMQQMGRSELYKDMTARVADFGENLFADPNFFVRILTGKEEGVVTQEGGGDRAFKRAKARFYQDFDQAKRKGLTAAGIEQMERAVVGALGIAYTYQITIDPETGVVTSASEKRKLGDVQRNRKGEDGGLVEREIKKTVEQGVGGVFDAIRRKVQEEIDGVMRNR